MKKRVFIERKNGFDIERQEMVRDIKHKFNVNLESRCYLVVDCGLK